MQSGYPWNNFLVCQIMWATTNSFSMTYVLQWLELVSAAQLLLLLLCLRLRSSPCFCLHVLWQLAGTDSAAGPPCSWCQLQTSLEARHQLPGRPAYRPTTHLITSFTNPTNVSPVLWVALRLQLHNPNLLHRKLEHRLLPLCSRKILVFLPPGCFWGRSPYNMDGQMDRRIGRSTLRPIRTAALKTTIHRYYESARTLIKILVY